MVSVIFSLSILLLLLCGTVHSSPYLSNDRLNADEVGAVAGRVVSLPAKEYSEAFKAPIKLGQCPLVMQEGRIKMCKDEFEGEEVYLPKGEMVVDVTRVQSSEDILLHVMGGLGASVGVLGLASVSAKVKVAVTTQTNRNTLNLMSSYQMSKGVLTLHRPRPKNVEGDKALFLSEIELGGNEMLLVTLEFKSEEQKVEVEYSLTFKVLFISITAKLNYVHKNFKAEASCRVQFTSSWRAEVGQVPADDYFSSLPLCISRVQELEDKYLEGPKELRELPLNDARLHYFYYFSSWKESPYGMQFNLALINHDLEFLTEQNTEIKAVIQRINKLNSQKLSSDVRNKMIQLNETLTDMTNKITTGLDNYHTLQPLERQKLRDIYGQNKAPQYYWRYLEKMTAKTSF